MRNNTLYYDNSIFHFDNKSIIHIYIYIYIYIYMFYFLLDGTTR